MSFAVANQLVRLRSGTAIGDCDSGTLEPVDNLTPERLYEKRWALTLLDLVLTRLREEFLAAGKLELFDTLGKATIDRIESGRGIDP